MIKKLVEAGVHFGHLVSRWCPKMRPYIWGHRNKIHLIDVSKTARYMEKAATFLESVSSEGKQILWVGTKKAAQGPITQMAKKTTNPCVNHRWIGGTLSNNIQVKKSVAKLQHLEDIIAKSEQGVHHTKKELNVFLKAAQRLEKNVGGIRKLRWPIGAVVIVDVRKEAASLREAISVGIPVVGLVDTNSDPSLVDYVIPANDDAPKSIGFILEYLGDAALKGAEISKKKAAEKKANDVKAKADKTKEKEVKVAKKVEPSVKQVQPSVKKTESSVKKVEPSVKQVQPSIKKTEPSAKQVQPSVKKVEKKEKNVAKVSVKKEEKK